MRSVRATCAFTAVLQHFKSDAKTAFEIDQEKLQKITYFSYSDQKRVAVAAVACVRGLAAAATAALFLPRPTEPYPYSK